jgi:hypothetical protein
LRAASLVLKTAPTSMLRHSRSFLRQTLGTLVSVAWISAPLAAANRVQSADSSSNSSDAIALAVVFDTSGSMNQPIATQPGSPPSPKIVVARRAFHAVIDRLEAFSKGPDAKPLKIGVYMFRRAEGAVAVPMGAFNAAALRTWLENVKPTGSTPLGSALFIAGRDVLAMPAASRHILVLTDGENTAGPKPEKVLAQLTEASTRKQTAVFTHIIALDIKPAIFAALQKQGATLIGAANETQLNQQFDFILEEKILVEAPRAAR